jgi:hypothetical protein
MARYTKQRDKFSCGPVAVHNLLIWAGVKVEFKVSIPLLIKMCKCIPIDGTSTSKLSKIVKKIGRDTMAYKCIETHEPTMVEIEKHMHEGGAILGQYTYTHNGKRGGHYYLLAGITPSGKLFKTVNYYREGKAVQYVKRKKFISGKHGEMLCLLLYKND